MAAPAHLDIILTVFHLLLMFFCGLADCSAESNVGQASEQENEY